MNRLIHLSGRQLLLGLLLLMNALFAANAQGGDLVRVGIAWQPTASSYDRVVRSIRAAGGEPVILNQMRPAGWEYDGMALSAQYIDSMGVLLQPYADIVKNETYHGTDIGQQMEGIGVVVFLGGGDISSTLLAEPQPWHGIKEDSPANATRDVSEYLTMAYCLDHDIPVLGLCRGMQMLAVVSGAPLIQDIPTYCAEADIEYNYLHRSQRDSQGNRHYTPHEVTVTDTLSLLYGIAGSTVITGAPSWHHQAVGDVTATPLKVTGITSDGGLDVIEAIERSDKHFALGVQFHPEEAIRKHLDHESDASLFMPLEKGVDYFKALIRAAIP